MDFIPEDKTAKEVPFFEDTTAKGGWAGHTTRKSTEKLQGEIGEAVNRLGGVLSGFQRGTYMIGDKKRDGYRVRYSLDGIPGQIDVAALPIRKSPRHSGYKNVKTQSLKMSLFMLRDALNGMWYLQQLSPGFAALMPFVLGPGNKTISQMWSEQTSIHNLLPPGNTDFEGDILDAEYEEA